MNPNPAHAVGRDLARETKFLRDAGMQIRSTVIFEHHCTTRLRDGQGKFGDRWTEIGLRDFLRELGEEAADLAAWAALADQALDRMLESGMPVAAELRWGLMSIARAGAAAHDVVSSLQHLLGAARGADEG